MPQNGRPLPEAQRRGSKARGGNSRGSLTARSGAGDGVMRGGPLGQRGGRGFFRTFVNRNFGTGQGQGSPMTDPPPRFDRNRDMSYSSSRRGHAKEYGAGFPVRAHSPEEVWSEGGDVCSLSSWQSSSRHQVGLHSWSGAPPPPPSQETCHRGPNPLRVQVSRSPEPGPCSPSSYQPPAAPLATMLPDAMLLSPSVQVAMETGSWSPQDKFEVPVGQPVRGTPPPLPPHKVEIKGRGEMKQGKRAVHGPEWHGAGDLGEDMWSDTPIIMGHCTHGISNTPITMGHLRDQLADPSKTATPITMGHPTPLNTTSGLRDQLADSSRQATPISMGYPTPPNTTSGLRDQLAGTSRQAWHPLTTASSARPFMGGSLTYKRAFSQPPGQPRPPTTTAAGKMASQTNKSTSVSVPKINVRNNQCRGLFPVPKLLKSQSSKQKTVSHENIENEPPVSTSTPQHSPSWQPNKRSKLPDILSEVPPESSHNTSLTSIADNYSEDKPTTSQETSAAGPPDSLSEHYHDLSLVTPEKQRHLPPDQKSSHCNCSLESIDLGRCEEPHDSSQPTATNTSRTSELDLTADSMDTETNSGFIGPVLPEGVTPPGIQARMPHSLLLPPPVLPGYPARMTADCDDGENYLPGQMSPSMQAVSEYEKQVSACYCRPSQSEHGIVSPLRAEFSSSTHHPMSSDTAPASQNTQHPAPHGHKDSACVLREPLVEPSLEQPACPPQSCEGGSHTQRSTMEQAELQQLEPTVILPTGEIPGAPLRAPGSHKPTGVSAEQSCNIPKIKVTLDKQHDIRPLMEEPAYLGPPSQKPPSVSQPPATSSYHPSSTSQSYDCSKDKRRMQIAESMGVAGILKRIRNTEDPWNGFPARPPTKPASKPSRWETRSSAVVSTAQREIDWFDGVPNNWEDQKSRSTPTSRSQSVSDLVSPLSRPGSGCGSSASDSLRLELVSPYRSLCFTPDAGVSPDTGSRHIYSYDTSRSTPDSTRSTPEGLDSVTWSWKTWFLRRYGNLTTPYIDTHCHLDFLFQRSGFKGGTFHKFCEENMDTFPAAFGGCVAIFCNPLTFQSEGLWSRLLEEDRVWGAVGCHPKCVSDFSESREMAMRRMLQHPRMVALGEIGLDYSGTFYEQAERQRLVFRRQLQMALDIGKPLVIHCRDAEQDTIQIMEEVIPRNYRIHRHCFTGGWLEAQTWLTKFPNSYIGLTPIVTFRNSRGFGPREVAKYVPLDRLLLETDAPYFVPWKIPRSEGGMIHSHPGMAVTVAAEVAHLRGVPISMVLEACRLNTRHMYGI